MFEDYDQKIASECLDIPSLIISGAGCGKTTTLIKKITNIINSGIHESEILVISFTNETVNNFINKCPYKVDVFTFHKLALKYIYDSNCNLVPEDLLDSIIIKVLSMIPNKLKLRLYNMYNKRIFKLNNNLYNIFINNKNSFSVFSCIKSIIMTINSENIVLDNLDSSKFSKNESIILYISKIIIDEYTRIKKENNLIDFDDMIIKATDNLNDNITKCEYKYILVDEYQDISRIRRNFLKALIKSSNAILTAVGDDFQAIYGFSGSNISLFYSFKNDFLGSKIFYIRKTYRCPLNFIKIAGKFVMKNPSQMKKELLSNLKYKGKIRFYNNYNTNKTFSKIIIKFIKDGKSAFILSRNNFDINKYINKDIRFENTYLVYKENVYKNIRFLTIHKAKGLEAENVLIINLTKGINGLPSLKKNNIVEKIKNNKEKIKHAEERRLMYVAMTRAKENLYLLIDQNSKSVFVKEIKKLTHKS